MLRKINKIKPELPVLPKRKRVAAYARVSMETDRLMHSLSAQVSYYSDLIQKNPEWEYAGVYADSFITGTDTKKRSEFNRLVADCDAGLIDIVLCKSISRFARNTVDLLVTVRHLKELGIEVRFEKEGINSLSGDGELMLTVLASFAEQESRSISENCKWGIRKRHAEVYKSRETMKYLHYDLSLFIKCDVCGQNLTAQVREFADGTREVRWVCTKHRKFSPDGVKPPHMHDAEIKNMVAEILGFSEFNAEIMCQKLKYISAYGDILTFHFHDGHYETRKYIPPKRKYRRRKENLCQK